ncbi:MAG: hypothetical protein HY901_13995 [Deltaproteobacteria bacterium]|nr:hypothetical protein [Deltaproteobacteria bacterium]
MDSIARMFEMGGWMMYVLVLVALLAALASLALPIVAFAAGKARLATLFAMLLGILGLAAAGLGAIGRGLGMRMVEQALAHVNPADAEVVRAVGSGESRVCLAFGLAVAVAPLAAACVCLGRALTEKATGLATAGGLALACGLAVFVAMLASQQFLLVEVETAFGAGIEADLAALLAHGREAASKRLGYGFIAGTPLAIAGIMLLAVGSRRRAAA